MEQIDTTKKSEAVDEKHVLSTNGSSDEPHDQSLLDEASLDSEEKCFDALFVLFE